MLMLIGTICMMGTGAETADMVEVRGSVMNITGAQTADLTWNACNFGAFWYDLNDNLMTETLTITATDDWGNPTLTGPYDRTLDESTLVYQTHPVFHEYKLHENEADPNRTTATAMENDYTGGRIGLCVESDNPGGDCGYFIEGWMAEKYVAIDSNADKLCKLLVEFEDDDKKTLATGEEWDLGSGFTLVADQIDPENDMVWFSLAKNGAELDNEVVAAGTAYVQDRVYTYTADIGDEEDIPVFSCYVHSVFGVNDTNIVQVKYVFLIDDDVTEIETSQTYGAMEVRTASSNEIILDNDESTIDLDADTTGHIMGDMYFKTADDDTAIRFYPYVAKTESGTYELRGTVVELDANNPALVGNQIWNYSTFAVFWYDLDDDLQTENLMILAEERDKPGEDTLRYPGECTIGEGSLVYTTHPVFHEYKLHENEADPNRTTATAMENDYTGGRIGLCVESDNPGGDCGYFIEGWMAEKYVAIDTNADKLCELLVEFEDGDKKTLSTGEEWDLGSGFSLVANQIDHENDKIWFSLKKNGMELDTEVVAAGTANAQDRVYTYTADIGDEEDIPVFSCLVDAVLRVNNTNIVQVMYVFLLDDDVQEIETSESYGVMEVMTASSNQIVLINDETTLDLDAGTIEHIMGDMYFMTADNDGAGEDGAIRFYPYVECTIGDVADTTAPTISLVTLSPTTVVSGGLVTVTVVATDASGIANVTANGTTGTVMLTSIGSDIWQGTITAPGTNGTCTVAVVATDTSTNANANTDTSKSFTIIDRVAGDVTGDGVVNIGDAVLLFNWVSFPNERGTTYVLK